MKRIVTVLILILIIPAFIAFIYQFGKQSNLPNLPIKVSARPALMGKGEVLGLENLTRESIPLKIHVQNPTFGKQRDFNVIAEPGNTEIGHLEGWAFTKGDVIDITRDGFKPGKYICP